MLSNLTALHNMFLTFIPYAKGQLISKCLFGAIISTKKTNEIILRISALASKNSLNQKKNNYMIMLDNP